MAYNDLFPLLGFTRESNRPTDGVIYQCWFGQQARIALWKCPHVSGYELNIYHPRFTDESMTHMRDRISTRQKPILVEDAFEAQLAINYLVQKYLPTGVTDDICHADQAKRTHATTVTTAQQEIRSLHPDAAAGETLE